MLPTLRHCSVSVFENILNFASSPMNLTVLFFVSMLIWSFLRIYKDKQILGSDAQWDETPQKIPPT